MPYEDCQGCHMQWIRALLPATAQKSQLLPLGKSLTLTNTRCLPAEGRRCACDHIHRLHGRNILWQQTYRSVELPRERRGLQGLHCQVGLDEKVCSVQHTVCISARIHLSRCTAGLIVLTVDLPKVGDMSSPGPACVGIFQGPWKCPSPHLHGRVFL